MKRDKFVLRASFLALTLAVCTPAMAQTAPPAATAQERVWSRGAEQIRLFTPTVWATPRGAGVNIAIIDTGLLTNHVEFSSAGKLLGGYDAFTDRTGLAFVGDTAGHGTHVASLAAAEFDGLGMMGTAPQSGLFIAKVFQSGSSTDFFIQRGIAYANRTNAFVLNMSLGSASPSPLIRNALQASVASGKLVVAAAGNDGAANPSWPARHASEAWAAGQIIAVGAVDSQNLIASFSNRAGDARNFYIVAPGVNLIGAHPASTNTYAMMSGTSMAAPIVAGAAATVKSNWRFLTARNVADILFLSATDLGAPGVDPIYGRGLLNLEAALRPIGVTTTVTANGATTNRLTYRAGTVTVGALAAAAKDGVFQGAVFDQFGRDFAADLGADLVRRKPDGVAALSQSLGARLERTSIVRSGGATIAFTSMSPAQTGGLSGASYLATTVSGDAIAFGLNGAAPLIGEQALAPAGGPPITRLGFASQDALLGGSRLSVAARRTLAPRWSLAVGGDHVERAPRFETPGARPAGTALVMEMEAAWRGERAAAGFAVATIRETGARLGDDQRALGVAGEARTISLRTQASKALSPRTSIGVSATVARTEAQTGAVGSFVRDAEATTSAGLAVSLAHEGVLARGDRVDLTIGTPLATAQGALDVAFATGADRDTGAPIVETRTISLASRTPEARVELAYARPHPVGAFGAAVMWRENADGVAGAQEAAIAARWRRAF
ncbi:MAG: S8 family serine peptidase [Alphaproteobacteria bacterium]|nr:S8 family serine peptidase [Alphaproteobacteria bacterium]